jgi:hypothetical protein
MAESYSRIGPEPFLSFRRPLHRRRKPVPAAEEQQGFPSLLERWTELEGQLDDARAALAAAHGREPQPAEEASVLLALVAEERLTRLQQESQWQQFYLRRARRRELQVACCGWISVALFAASATSTVVSGDIGPLHLLHAWPWW